MENRFGTIITVLLLTKIALSLPIQSDTMRLTSPIADANRLIDILIKQVPGILKKQTIKKVEVKDLNLLGTKLNITLTNITFPGVYVNQSEKIEVLHPLDIETAELSLYPLSLNITSQFDIEILERFKKTPKIYKGDMQGNVTSLKLDLTLKSVSNAGDQVNLVVEKKAAVFDIITIHFSDPDMDKLWQRLFGSKASLNLLFNTVILPKIKKAIEGLNLAKLLDLNVFTFGAKAGFNDLIRYPRFPGLPETDPLGIQLQLYVQLLAFQGGELAPAPAVLDPDMTLDANSYEYVTISMNNDLFNQAFWFLSNSQLLAIEYNQDKAGGALPFNLDTKGIEVLFPRIKDLFPNKNSVIVYLTVPDTYSKKKMSFRAIQGRYAIKLAVNIEFHVFKEGYDPKMTLDDCEERCVQVLDSELDLYLTASFGMTNAKELAFSYLNLEIGSAEFRDGLFPVEKENFLGLVNGLVDGLAPSQLPTIDLSALLEGIDISFDVKDGQRGLIEISLDDKEKGVEEQ